jgi:lysophospholipase L1-like esterase
MVRRVMFWLMLPLSAVQGLWLRRVATRLPGAPGARQGSTGAGEPVRFLALGDSIIDGVGTADVSASLPGQFARLLAQQTRQSVFWRVEGKSGFAIDDILERLESLRDITPPDIVLVSVGVNDVTGLSSTRRWRAKLEELLNLMDQYWPGARIIFAGLPPMSEFPLPPQPLRFTLGLRAATLDQIAAEIIATYPNARHVPTLIDPQQPGFCEDGFHPSAESCTLWASHILQSHQGVNPHD